MPICPLCDEPYEPTDRDLPDHFCDHCAEAVDNWIAAGILRKHFNAEVVSVILN